MLEISPHLFVVLILSCVLSGVGVCLLVTLPNAKAMRKTNAEFQNQVGVQGEVWELIFIRQQSECERWRRIAGEMERRLWIVLRMDHGDKKGPSKAEVAKEMLGEPSAPSLNPSVRQRSRGPLTGPEEVQRARKAKQNRMISRGVGVPESTDGTNSK